jgi:Xaa-Pro aminopeptidase
MSVTSHPAYHRLRQLREAMQAAGIQAWIIPSNDPHQSEYVAEHWQARAYYSGFTGSAGTLVVTQTTASLWTDSRYYLQAEQQLPDGLINLHKTPGNELPDPYRWLGGILAPGDKIGTDGRLLSIQAAEKAFASASAGGLTLVTELGLSGQVWQDRPALPDAPIFVHAIEFAGQSRADKLRAVRTAMADLGVSHHLVCTLDDIAWTLNLRGADVRSNPTFYAYLLIDAHRASLLIDTAKVSDDITEALREDGVQLLPYDSLPSLLSELQGTLLLDTATTSHSLSAALPTALQVQHGATLPIALKSIKNPVEIMHLRRTMAKDGVALFRLYRWLQAQLPHGVTEDAVARQLIAYRSEQAHYRDESFDAIVGYAANGAIVHYRPEPGHSATIRAEGILLLDSGGQYLDGTTDITRTFALGDPTSAQRRNATLVLKGHIQLATMKFPAGTSGAQLDSFARMHLWQHGLNYGHGTGHGVGFFLNVHEGPQGIAGTLTGRSAVRLEAGMLTSNEPGYYETGAYGIRIENLVLCVELEQTSYGRFLGFETLSLFPIDTTLVDRALLTSAERDWLNAYHLRVLETLSPLLTLEEQEELTELCSPI